MAYQWRLAWRFLLSIAKKPYYTYIAMGDGELQEGLIWEAAMCAS